MRESRVDDRTVAGARIASHLVRREGREQVAAQAVFWKHRRVGEQESLENLTRRAC